MEMQRITNPSPFMSTEQPFFQIPFTQEICICSKITMNHFSIIDEIVHVNKTPSKG